MQHATTCATKRSNMCHCARSRAAMGNDGCATPMRSISMRRHAQPDMLASCEASYGIDLRSLRCDREHEARARRLLGWRRLPVQRHACPSPRATTPSAHAYRHVGCLPGEISLAWRYLQALNLLPDARQVVQSQCRWDGADLGVVETPSRRPLSQSF